MNGCCNFDGAVDQARRTSCPVTAVHFSIQLVDIMYFELYKYNRDHAEKDGRRPWYAGDRNCTCSAPSEAKGLLGRPSDAIEKPASGCTADDLNAETWERNIECALGLLDRFGVINQGNLVRAIDPPKPALERGLRLT
jgi:hypothetical protein